MGMDCHSEYLAQVLLPTLRSEAVNAAVRILHGVHFDAIACCGNSGTLFAGALGLRMNKPVILVRKKLEGTHSAMLIEGPAPPDVMSYIMVDDFIITGTTMLYVVEQLHNDKQWRAAKFVGVYTYHYDSFHTCESLIKSPCSYAIGLKRLCGVVTVPVPVPVTVTVPDPATDGTFTVGEAIKILTDTLSMSPSRPPDKAPPDKAPPPTQWYRYASDGKIEEVK